MNFVKDRSFLTHCFKIYDLNVLSWNVDVQAVKM